MTVHTLNAERRLAPRAPGRIFCVVLALLAVTAVAHAQEAAPDEHYRHGVELAKAGKLHEAREEFKAAYALRPHARVSYNLAKLSLELGEKQEAINYLRAYLAFDVSALSPLQVAEVRSTLAELEGEARAEQPATAAAPPAELSPTPPAGNPSTNTAPEVMPAPDSGARGQSAGARLPLPASHAPRAPTRVQASPLPAIALTSTGVALLLGGAGIWFWNDNTYDDAVLERDQLARNPPASPHDAADLDRVVEHAHAVGRNDERFDAVQHFDVLALTTIGIGAVCTAAGTWMLFNAPQSRVIVGSRSVGVRW